MGLGMGLLTLEMGMHSTLPGSRRCCQVNVSAKLQSTHVATDAFVRRAKGEAQAAATNNPTIMNTSSRNIHIYEDFR